jgi:hypothetical protein
MLLLKRDTAPRAPALLACVSCCGQPAAPRAAARSVSPPAAVAEGPAEITSGRERRFSTEPPAAARTRAIARIARIALGAMGSADSG